MKASMTRRTFLKTSLAGLTGLTLGYRQEPLFAKDPNQPQTVNAQVTVFLNIDESGAITIVCARAEMGQGIATGFAQIVAEELEADWSTISIELRPELEPYDISWFPMTVGSMSTQTHYTPLREIGAAAKQMLLSAAAQRWGVSVDSLQAENGYVTHPEKGSLGYGELAAEAGTLPIPEKPQLKDPADFTIVGTSRPRLDAADHLSGSAVYATDVVVDKMLYASIRHSPVFGGTVNNFESLSADGVELVELPGAVAAVADSWWQAESALKGLSISWRDPILMEPVDNEYISGRLNDALDRRGQLYKNRGLPQAALALSSQTVQARYEVPFLAHAPMEPMNCTARVTANSCELWVPTQAAYLVQEAAAELTGLPLSAVTVHTPPLGGGFGRKAEVDYVNQAVRITMAVGRPVNLIWPRAEDTRQDRYRPAFTANMQAGLTADGALLALQTKTAGPPIAENPLVDFYAIAGLSDIPYSIPHMRMRLVETDVGIPVGYWRSIGHSQNSFFVESFMDELAEAAGKDPLAFRRQHLADNKRAVAVLDAVRDFSGWGTPQTAGASQGVGFLSMAKSYVAMVVEAAVVNGAATIYRVYCVIDCGQVLNPDLVKAQMEGGIVFGLSAALWGEMTISGGRVIESNFSDYRIMRMSDSPEIETMVMQSSESPGGVGELGVPLSAPALTNAIYAATGTRIRTLPLSRHTFS